MRRHNENRLSRWVLSLSLCFALVQAGHAQIYTADSMAPYETEALGDGLYTFRIGMHRSLFMVGDDGVIATDPLNVEAAKIFRQEIAKITNKPVKYVAYSNSFLNHVVGGKIFKDEGATFVAQEKCAANLAETPHRDVVMPDITYSDSHIIKVGEVSLELYYLGLSYGNCLSVMIARPANIMMVANIINPPVAALPWDPTLANYYIHNLVPFFNSLEVLTVEQNVERVVAAFGVIENAPNGGPQLAPSTAPISMIGDQRVFWELLIAAVKTEFDAGSPARVIPKRVDMKIFSDYAGYDERNLEIMMRRVYSLHRIGR